ncbi:MAG TPA: helix-turn-helix domain-containing protein [Stellaceae bacterium]|nr:helix-turn-helix domain-containing protein [Stellaceae bacterium]
MQRLTKRAHSRASNIGDETLHTNTQNPNVQPLWVHPARAAQLADLSRTTIYKLMREGRLENRKIGRSRLVGVASLERLEDAAA